MEQTRCVYRVQSENLDRRHHFEDPHVHRRIKLNTSYREWMSLGQIHLAPERAPCECVNGLLVTEAAGDFLITSTTVSFSRPLFVYLFSLIHIHKKGKAVPLQTWSGPEGSRKLRFPDFMTTAQDGGKVVSLRHRPHLPPGNTPGTHFR